MILLRAVYPANASYSANMQSVFSSVNGTTLDNASKQAYTKARELCGLAESTNAGGVKMIEYLKQYKSELMAKDLVRQNQVPYMVGWVHRFLSLGEHEETVFADVLEKEGREDWQIRQALDAVGIYNSMFCQPVVEGCDAAVSSKAAVSDLDQIKKKLRVRHYAQATEKAYGYWCSKYSDYCSVHFLDKKADSSASLIGQPECA